MAAVARQSSVQFNTSGNIKDNSKDTPSYLRPVSLSWSSLSSSSAAAALSSSPLASDDSSSCSLSSLSSQGSSNSSGISLEDYSDDLPTPGDIDRQGDSREKDKDRAREAILNSASSAIANINRKRRVVWDLHHRASCASSPKHRFHPYSRQYQQQQQQQQQEAKQVNNENAVKLNTSSSSSPSRRASLRHRRTSSAIRAGLSSTTAATTFAPPRSILKSLRNSRVSQYGLLSHSSPGKRALHASPGGGTSGVTSATTASSTYFQQLYSPSASPRRRSTATFTPTRSPGKSPRIPSLFFNAVTGSAKSKATKSPSLAEITRANGGGRAHTIAFPDLRALPVNTTSTVTGGPTQQGQDNVVVGGSTMMMSLDGITGAALKHKNDEPAQGLLPQDLAAADGARSNRSVGSGGVSNSTSNGLVGLGLGQPFEDAASKGGKEEPQPQEEAQDPRLQIISACHTLRHSLAQPVWEESTASSSGSNNNINDGLEENDCFDSQPFDFPPRNIEHVARDEQQFAPASSASTTGSAVPAVHLRELEAAYATIFRYAQVYIQSWYNTMQQQRIASDYSTVETIASHTSNFHNNVGEGEGASATSTTSAKEDDIDRDFAKLAPLVVKCIFRDIHRALNPVPVPTAQAVESTVESSAQVPEASTSNALPSTQSKGITTVEETREAKNTLLHRTGLLSPAVAKDTSGGEGSDDDPPTSSPLVFPAVDSPHAPGAATAAATTAAADKAPEKPKRMGRSTAEMRRRRNELHVVEAALQAFGTLLACEQFWRYFDVESLRETLLQAALLPHSNMFKGPKNRDMLSSFNWIIANQTITRPLYLPPGRAGSRQLLQPILPTLATAVMASINASTKNGEKARRVMSEGFRALRTLVLCYPSQVLTMLTTSPNLGKIAFFAKYLCSPTKPLRDNAALLLASIALGMTAGWDDESPDCAMKKYKMQEMITIELFRYWALDPVEIDELSRHLNAALDSKLASDYNYVRLVVNTLPIILGRRFRKMERKGPHMWLSKVVELKRRGDATTPASPFAPALHLMTFVHVTHSWAAGSKEAACRALLQDAGASSDIGSEELWGLGEKALRVVAQNIEHVAAKNWTKEAYSNLENAIEVNAAVSLITSLIYTFVGLAITVRWSPSVLPASMTVEDRLTYANPNLQRDLSRIWTVLISKHLPILFASGILEIHSTGWQILQALLRQGEEHPEEDVTINTWSMDRIINIRMLGGCVSQASQALEPIENVISETVSPASIPALDTVWLIDHRADVMSMLETAFTGFAGNLESTCLVERDCQDWVKNEDGYPLMPAELSNCIRNFLYTIRSGFADEDSQSRPAEPILLILHELSTFLISLVDYFVTANEIRSAAPVQSLSPEGTAYSVAHHFLGLLELAFGQTWLASETENGSSAGLFQRRIVNAAQSMLPADAQTGSAYSTTLESVFKHDDKAFSPRVLGILSQRVQNLRAHETDAAAAAARAIWNTSARLLDRRLQHVRQAEDKGSSTLPQFKDVTMRFMRLAPTIEVDERNSFENILAMHSGGSAAKAWFTLQAIAESTTSQGGDADAFFGWALLPLMRRLSDLCDHDDFIAKVTRIVALSATIAHSSLWSLPDITDALLVGIKKTSDRQFATVLANVHPILLTICEAPGLPNHTRSVFFKTILEAVEGAYRLDGGRPELQHLSAILATCPNDCEEMLADVWNITFGNGHETLTLETNLRERFAKMTEAGHVIRLPGSWIEDGAGAEVAEFDIQIEESESRITVDEAAAKTASTDVVEETQTQVILSQPALVQEPTSVAADLTVQNEEALESQETEPSPTVPNDNHAPTEIENIEETPQSTTIKEKSLEWESAQPLRQGSPALIETAINELQAEEPSAGLEDSISAIAETEVIILDKANTTQMPSLSQIPDVSTIMAERKEVVVVVEESATVEVEDSAAVNSPDTTLVPPQTVSTTDQGDEESFRSIVPETQERDLQETDHAQHVVATVHPTADNEVSTDPSEGSHEEESHTEWVPETQKESQTANAVSDHSHERETEVTTSAEINHIEETQEVEVPQNPKTAQVVSAESSTLEKEREPSAELPEVIPRKQQLLPSPPIKIHEDVIGDDPVVHNAPVQEDISVRNADNRAVSPIEVDEIAETQEINPVEPPRRPALVQEASFTSVASGSTDGNSQKPRRKRQIVEVVIPYRPWLSRSSTGLSNKSHCHQPAHNRKQEARILPEVPVPVPTQQQRQQLDKAKTADLHLPPQEERKRSRDGGSEKLLQKKQRRETVAEHHKDIITRHHRDEVPTPNIITSKSISKDVERRPKKAGIAPSIERRLKGSTSLPTIIHKRPTEAAAAVYAADDLTDAENGNNDSDSDDFSSSSEEEEIYVASSPSVARHIRNISDSIELSKKANKRSRSSTSSQGDDDEDYTPESDRAIGNKRKNRSSQHREEEDDDNIRKENHRTSSSPTVAASQRKRAYSQSSSNNNSNGYKSDNVHRATKAHKKPQTATAPSISSSSRYSNSTAQTGRLLAQLLEEGRDEEIDQVLEDLDEQHMKNLHRRIEMRLRRVYGVKPMKKIKR